MNQNNHGPPRRSSASFNRHTHTGGHSSRSNHSHGHQRWPNRYMKDYRDYEQCFSLEECPVNNGNGSPKENGFIMQGYPKPQLSPGSRTGHIIYNNETSGHERRLGSGMADRRHMMGPGTVQSERRHPHVTDRRHPIPQDRRHISPPLRINICDTNPSIHSSVGQQGDSLLLPRSNISIEFSPRRNGRDMRVSPVQLQHSPPFFRAASNDEGIKSESPSRKRRRLSRSSHHQIIEQQGVSPPHPHHGLHSPWDYPVHRRSPRQHPSPAVSNPVQTSPPLRRPRFWERPPPVWPQDYAHAHRNSFTGNQTTEPTHPHAHQSPVVLDINQVPVTLPISHEPIWTYSAPHISLCSAAAAPAAHIHSCQVYGPHAAQFPPQSCQLVAPAAPCLSHHQAYAASFSAQPRTFASAHASLQLPPAQHYPHTHQHLQSQRPEGLDIELPAQHVSLHMATPHHQHLAAAAQQVSQAPGAAATLFPTAAAAAALDVLHVRAPPPPPRRLPPPPIPPRRAHPTRTTRWHPSPLPMPAPAPYPFLLQFLAMFSNPPLSPYSQADLSSSDSTETENYEALLSLAERLGEAKPRGLAKMEIEQLPSYKYNAETHEGDQTSCVVCMCDFEQRQLLRVLPCSHEFHAKCVDKWLRSNRTCPICRGNASDYFNNSD